VGTARCAVPAGAVPSVASGTGGGPAADGKAPDRGRRSAAALPIQTERHIPSCHLILSWGLGINLATEGFGFCGTAPAALLPR